MGKTAKIWWNIFVVTKTICSGLLWARSLLYGSIKIIGDMELHPPFFFIIFMLGGAIIVGLNYSWISAWIGPKLKTDRQRFYEYHRNLLKCQKALIFSLHSERVVRMQVEFPQLLANAIDNKTVLNRFGIECPSLDLPGNEFSAKWLMFISAMVSLSELRDLKSAQRCLEELNQLEKENKSQKSS